MTDFRLNTAEQQITSEQFSLDQLVSRGFYFNVPLYQRLYVWEDVQILTLLEDIHNASNGQPYYFIGGMMVRARINDSLLDLVDGQQRFTTIWLIAMYLGGQLAPFTGNNEQARIYFEIRDFANQYFEDPSVYGQFGKEARKELEPIINGLRTIRLFFESEREQPIDERSFAHYLYHDVRMVVTQVPANIDDNRLFEVLNNRGLQLQHHQILKSILLEALPDNERGAYGKLWEACADMDAYIERNVKELSGLTWKELMEANEQESETWLRRDVLHYFRIQTPDEKHHLWDLISGEVIPGTENENGPSDLLYDAGKVRSIISFPMLLLHTLRIYLYRKSPDRLPSEIPAVNEKKLLRVFHEHLPEKSGGNAIREFLDLLMDVRMKFDRYVIKWVVKDNSTVQQIQKLYKSKDILQRREPESSDGFAMLQGMLYHSQEKITQYWLTPLLFQLLKHDDRPGHYNFLRKLDNDMFCSGNLEDLRLRTWTAMDGRPAANYSTTFIHSSKGTGFWSYWFYKLDFVLWYYRAQLQAAGRISDKDAGKWETYRMTAKNSIEHISPQQKREGDQNLVYSDSDSAEVKRQKLDDFGNLVLISPGMNSEYSNKPYFVKFAEFREKLRPDSLKSAMIFQQEDWSFARCEAHRNEMEALFLKYFTEN
ncbi:DUF262 domain-containing protein [Mucilaginibacter angelicae]|uniref:DUF262 domain-containing protein n=1 Tax=Mucilaginibacter angelicae TaxID=869718 RepID=A0ABV6L1A9_9SPHI